MVAFVTNLRLLLVVGGTLCLPAPLQRLQLRAGRQFDNPLGGFITNDGVLTVLNPAL